MLKKPLDNQLKKFKIFWNHPMLMDYRKPLFDKMASNYDIIFFFNKENPRIPNNYKYIVSKKQYINKGVSLQDIINFVRQIYTADIFITSFLLSTFTILGIIISKILKKKIIVWEELMGESLGMKDSIRRKLSSIISKFCNAFFVLGVVQKNALIELGVKSNLIFIANEYPGNIFWDSSTSVSELENRKFILNIGRFVEFKGIAYLIRAFKIIQKKHNGLYLYIVGEGELKDSLIDECKNIKAENIFFFDYVADIKAKQELYNQAKMVIVPSIICKTGREGGPLVIVEALSAGTPVIASNCTGSTGHFIKDCKNGYIVEQKNITQLSEKMDRLLKNIEKKEITRKSVKITFDEIPNHCHQYDILNSAIHSIL